MPRQLTVLAVMALMLTACAKHHAPKAITPVATADEFENLVRLVFPSDVETVEHAATYLLTGTGFKLDWACSECSYAGFLKDKPISPLAYRPDETTTLRRALVLIVGSEGRVIVNRDTKKVSLTLVRHSELAARFN